MKQYNSKTTKTAVSKIAALVQEDGLELGQILHALSIYTETEYKSLKAASARSAIEKEAKEAGYSALAAELAGLSDGADFLDGE